jgi:NDP-sugar pyrophosphorylase family protein
VLLLVICLVDVVDGVSMVDVCGLDDLWVVIPVGGRASRLLPLTVETSKACLRLLNRPLVEFSLVSLVFQGVRNVVFGVKGYVNYRNLCDCFGSGIGFSAYYGVEPRLHIKYQHDVVDLGSADSARINLEYFDLNGDVFVVQGDNVFDVDLRGLMDFHRGRDAALTIVLREVDNVEGFGVADIGVDGRIKRFVEKPSPNNAPSNLANTGLYVMSPRVRQIFKDAELEQLVKERGRLDFGYDFIPYVIEAGYPVYGYTLKGSWFDVGTPANYLAAMKSLLHRGFLLQHVFGECVYSDEDCCVWVQGESSHSVLCRERILAQIRQKKIHVKGAVLIGRHCQIDDGAFLSDCCIDNFTYIGKNAVVKGSAVMDRAVIGEYTEVLDSIVGRYVTICSSKQCPTKLFDLTVIADDVTIEEGSIFSGSKVYPHQTVKKGVFTNQILLAPV